MVFAEVQGKITLGDKAILNPPYICYDPELIKYVPPVVKTCTQDPTQDKCIKTCD